MKITRATLALSVAALLTLGSSAMAVQPNSNVFDPTLDETGFQTFGVNIAFAGNTPEAVKNFVAGLTPDQQQRISTGCGDVLSDATMARNFTVTSFCKNLNS